MQAIYQPNEIIDRNYKIINILGEGGVGITYAAEHLPTKQKVALKVLSLQRMNNWKTLELFEREAKILSQLNHPAIPQYIDYFQVDTPETRSFYLVQQLASGKTLSELINQGWKPEENEVKKLAIQILEVLVYLQQLTPPIIHRDIKPQNMIRQEDGKVFLVDFGAVQDIYHHTVTGGSTVVGTFGYMAPEQFRGQASLSTDLYGLGTTLLFLLTRKEPDKLPQKKLKINFRSYIYLDKDFANWLDRTIEPAAEDRFKSAQEALAVLKGEKKLTILGIKPNSIPPKTLVSIKKGKGKLVITIPPVWTSSKQCQKYLIFSILWSLVWSLVFWVIIESRFLIFADFNKIVIFLLLPLIFMLLGISASVYFMNFAFLFTEFKLNQNGLSYSQWFTSYKLGKIFILDRVDNIDRVDLFYFGQPIFKNILTLCLIETSECNFGLGLFLSRQEQKWIIAEIKNFIKIQPSQST